MSRLQIPNHERILVALDVPTVGEAATLVERLKGKVGGFKIGPVLMYEIDGARFASELAMRGLKVMLDPKLHDVPDTVGPAMAKIVRDISAHFVTVHGSGGRKMVAAGAEAIKAKGSPLNILGITVLTSLDKDECREIYGRWLETAVPHFAMLAKMGGAKGLVCSPRDLPLLRNKDFDDMIRVTPGIRPPWAAARTQKRFTTPGQALLEGSDYLVIGSPIYDPPPLIDTPEKAVESIVREMEEPTPLPEPAPEATA